jgi:type I restriction enzyme S subunit
MSNSGTDLMLSPRLRFKVFNTNWKPTTFGSIAKIKNGYAFGGNYFVDEGIYLLLTPGNFKAGGGFKYQGEKEKFYSEPNFPKEYILKKGDLVTAMTEQATGLIGSPLIVPKDGRFLHNQRLGLFEFIPNQNVSFMYFIMQTTDLRKQFSKSAAGTKVRHTSTKRIECLQFPAPSLAEQTKIANFLSSVDKRIEQLTQKKALLEQYKKGVMQQLFTQKIRFKDDDGKDFPGWEEKKLGEVASVVGGGTPDSTNEDYWNGDVQWFTPSEIRSKFASCSKRKISQLGLSKCSASMLPVGTLLFTSRATIAEVSLATEPCTTNQGFQSITVNQGASNEFIYYWVIQFKKDFLRKAQGSTFLEIGGKEMRKMPMLIPSGPEQTKIAEFLSAIDRKIESVATQITETQTFKRGLLQQMFV